MKPVNLKIDQESILDRLSIAAPCSADWDNMVGDERERFCQKCTLNVYNISAMTKKEAAEFLTLRTQGRVCVQFYKRADGTILTDNCPSGLRAIRNRGRAVLKAASAFAAFLLSSNLFVWAQNKEESTHPVPTRGKVLIAPTEDSNPANKPIPLRGEVYIPPKQPDSTTKSDPACFVDSEKVLKEKISKLEKASKKNKLSIARAHLDLASFYRSKNHLDSADSEYKIAIDLLAKMPKEMELYKNSILNRAATLKLLGKTDEANKLEKSISNK